MTEIKPCPFCGNSAEYKRNGCVREVACTNDKCFTQPSTRIYAENTKLRPYGSREDAIAIWNTRP